MSGHGRLEIVGREYPDEKQSYQFTSVIGRQAIFFLDAGDFVFVGDHTTFTIDDA